MSKTAYALGALAGVLLLLAGAWPDLKGTVGFGVAGFIAVALFLFVAEDDTKRSR